MNLDEAPAALHEDTICIRHQIHGVLLIAGCSLGATPLLGSGVRVCSPAMQTACCVESAAACGRDICRFAVLTQVDDGMCLVQRNICSACVVSHSTRQDDCVGTMQTNRSQSTAFLRFSCIVYQCYWESRTMIILCIISNRGHASMSHHPNKRSSSQQHCNSIIPKCIQDPSLLAYIFCTVSFALAHRSRHFTELC